MLVAGAGVLGVDDSVEVVVAGVVLVDVLLVELLDNPDRLSVL